MAVRALNAGQLVEAEGTWPTNYVNFAIENDLAEEVNQIYSVPATRMTAATIVVNTLTAKMWEKSSVRTNGEITWTENDTKTILKDVLKIYELEDATIAITSLKDNEGTVSATVPAGQVAPTNDFAEKAGLGNAKTGLKYTVWYNKDEVLGFWVPENNDTVSFENIKEFNTDKSKVTFIVNGEEKKYELAQDDVATTTVDEEATIVLNDAAATDFDGLAVASYKNSIFGKAYLDKDGKVSKVFAESFDHYGVVDKIENKYIIWNTADIDGEVVTGGNIYMDTTKDSTYEYTVTKDGKTISIDDIEEDDVVFYYFKNNNNKKIVMNVMNNTVEGRISAITSAGKLKINGEVYNNLSGETFTAGKEGTFYLNDLGDIVMFAKDVDDNGEWAVVSKVRKLTATEVGKSYETEIKLALVDGTVTDWLAIDEKKNAENENSKYTAYFTKSGTDYETSTLIPGAIVKYEIADGKVEFPATAAEDKVTATGFYNGKVAYAGVYTAASGSTPASVSQVAFINDATKLVKIKEVKTGEEYKLVVLDKDDIKTGAQGFASTYLKLDSESETDLVIFAANASISAKAKNYAYIEFVDTVSPEGDDKDYKREVTVAFVGADKTETYLAKETISIDGSSADPATVANKLAEIVVENDKLVEVKTSGLNASEIITSTEHTYIDKKYTNGTISFKACAGKGNGLVATTAATAKYVVAEDVLVLEYDADEDTFTKSTLGNIGIIMANGENSKTLESDMNNANEVVSVYLDVDSKNETSEIVCIVYVK